MALRRLSVFGAVVWLAVHATPPTTSAQDPYQAGILEAMRQNAVLWRDPGPVEQLDFSGGSGGRENAPEPPFTFLKEMEQGRSVKVKVRDARGRSWVAKWGSEAKAENMASRIAWAAGYFVEPVYYVASGRIEGARDLRQAAKYVAADGSFSNARFQLWDDDLVKGNNWTWSYNPFVGTQELSGLKVVMILLSNWDNKDARDAGRGSNTAIRLETGASGPEYRYFMLDWGGSLGKWGLPGIGRDKWNCEGYQKQTPKFVKGIKSGYADMGFVAWHDIEGGITLDDLRWILGYVGRITDAQLRDGLVASGATPEETDCFSRAIRARIERLRQTAGCAAPTTASVALPR